MGRMTKRDERYLARCRGRIEAAKKFRKDEGYDDLWERLVDLYRGRHYPKGLQDEDRLIINIAFATKNVISPSVSVNNPKITVSARKPEHYDQAIITEAFINYIWKHSDIHSEFRRAVDDFLIVGFGWLKTGYRFVEEEHDDPDGYETEVAERQVEADDFAAENPHLAAELPTDDEIAQLAPRTKTVVVEDRPFAERVSYRDIYVDPDATSIRDMRWIAQRIERSLDEVRKDEKYNERARRKAEGSSHVSDDRRPKGVDPKDPCYINVEVWEFYDLVNGTMCVFADGGEEFLIDPEPQEYAFGHPFVMLRNYDVPDVFYPIGDLEMIEPLQHELNATRTAQLNDRKQKQRAWLYDERAFDKRGLKVLKSSQDNRMIPVSGNVELEHAVRPMPSQQLDAQLYQNSEIITHDIYEITAQGEYARGSEQEVRRTATEASIIQDAANSRAADKLAKVEQVISLVGRRLVQLTQQFATEAQVVRVTGVNGQPVWAEFEPDDIAGEFDFDVEGGSTQPMNEAGRRQQATQVMQTLSPMFGSGMVNEPEILRWVLQQFGVNDASRFLAAQSPVTAGLGAPTETPTEEAPPAPGGQSTPSADPGAAMGLPPGVMQQLQGQVGLNLGR